MVERIGGEEEERGWGKKGREEGDALNSQRSTWRRGHGNRAVGRGGGRGETGSRTTALGDDFFFFFFKNEVFPQSQQRLQAWSGARALCSLTRMAHCHRDRPSFVHLGRPDTIGLSRAHSSAIEKRKPLIPSGLVSREGTGAAELAPPVADGVLHSRRSPLPPDYSRPKP